MTILFHPDLDRVGERVVLTDLLGGKSVELSRRQPLFAAVRSGSPRPLADGYLSRKPIALRRDPAGGVALHRGQSPTRLLVDGVDCAADHRVSDGQIERGVVFDLADRIVLALHWFELLPPTYSASALIGESSALNRARHDIERVADLDFPVLLKGESGTGKELAARAIHACGPRRHKPFVAANVGAIPNELAAAELFGAAKGAFTGAHRARPGFFERAGQGTLFLDEIGIATPEIQVLLLRVLESGEIQPVGESPKRVEARVISATDADLDQATDRGEFRSPLLHRLAAFEIVLPPLRARKEDFGRLFLHFLRRELASIGEEDRLRCGEDGQPWLPPNLVSSLARYPWPGNVRQLRNVSRQIAVASRGQQQLTVPPRVAQMIAETDARDAERDGREIVSVAKPYRSPEAVDEDELLAALRAESFHISRTAERLGLSKASVYRLVDESPNVRKASELGTEDITSALEAAAGNIDDAAADLAVSARGLRLRMQKLGIAPPRR